MSQREGIVIMEYHVIQNESLGGLSKEVRKVIKQGWRPQGGVCVWIEHSGTWFAQAMVRETK